jgi:hypothetical protein
MDLSTGSPSASSSFRIGCFALLFLLLAGLAAFAAAPAQAPDCPAPNPALLTKAWPASWIAPDGISLTEYGVFHFRKHFTQSAQSEHFLVHVSADNRYRLFVNGMPVCFGPQRGDTMRWHFDSVDLAPYLRSGDNLLAAVVCNFGEQRPYALTSLRTGLIVQGDGPAEQVVNTGPSWRVLKDEAFAPLPPDQARLHTFFVAGPGDRVDGAAYPWNWETSDYDDSAWTAPRMLDSGVPYGHGTDFVRWLCPRSIPFMEETPQRLGRVRRAVGAAPGADFLAGRAPLTIPAHTEARLLLDQGFETNAFPRLVISGGKGATIALAYAEALVDAAGAKGDRGAVEGRAVVGVEDRFLPDGGAHRVFTTLDFRCYRYLELRAQTGAEPLVIEDLEGLATGYPFRENGSFASDDPTLSRVWEVGWRTARRCAFETYMDCPYYERLQYVGDTRIQGLISLYVSGDDRLLRNAIDLFDQSRIPEGLTQSRYPSWSPQLINTFSLFWVEMLHDYWMHRDDAGFVGAHLDGAEDVLRWFEQRIDPATGLLGPLPYWTFVDWPDEWPWDPAADIGGEAPGAHTGGSAIVSLQFALTLDSAAELFRANGRGDLAGHYTALADGVRTATMRCCWDEGRRLLADTPAKRSFSQHANVLAVLSRAISGERASELIGRVAHDRSLVPCTLYFRFYLLRAMKAAGLGDGYLGELGPWRDMIARGLTTFAERPEPTRSDCHAWSASPVYELLATVCGVEPGSPGFKTVRIEPHLGPLQRATGVVPHPAGLIRVELIREGRGLRGHVTLPDGVSGEFIWNGHKIPLRPGAQDLHL